MTFDLLEPLEEELRKKMRDKKERHRLQCERALAAFDAWWARREAPVSMRDSRAGRRAADCAGSLTMPSEPSAVGCSAASRRHVQIWPNSRTDSRYPIMALALRAVLGGCLDLYGRAYYARSYGFISQTGASDSLRSMGEEGNSRSGCLLSLGRMLHCRHGGCGSDFWPAWFSISDCADGPCHACNMVAASLASKLGRLGRGNAKVEIDDFIDMKLIHSALIDRNSEPNYPVPFEQVSVQVEWGFSGNRRREQRVP